MRTRLRIAEEPEAWIFLDIAEHSILRKLEWFRRGGEVSEQQWRDVVSMLRIQRGELDVTRLYEWAERLGVVDLLAAARSESGGVVRMPRRTVLPFGFGNAHSDPSVRGGRAHSDDRRP